MRSSLPVVLCLLAVSAARGQACAPDFRQADAVIETMVGAVPLPGAGLRVFRADGSIVHERMFGSYTPDTLLPVASASKWWAAAVLMTLVDDGTLPLDARVSTYLPYFTGAKAGMTVRQMFSMTSGLDGQDDAPCLSDRSTTLDLCAQQIAATVPMVGAPGRAFSYGGNAMQAAARVAEVASGKSWSTLFRERIKGPLGLTSTTWGLSANPLVAGGVFTTLGEYAVFLRMLMNGGTWNGVRVLSAEAIGEMQRDQSAGAALAYSPVPPYTHYGLGEWLDVLPGVPAGSEVSSPGKFGFYPWIDKARGYAGIFEIDAPDGAAADNLRLVANQVQQAVRDRLDAARAGLDADGDGVCDAADDCPAVADPQQADGDADGAGDACDAAPADPTLWSAPGEAAQLIVMPDGKTLDWMPSPAPGGYVVNDRYDVVRSTTPADFVAPATCEGTNVPAFLDRVQKVDADVPSAGGAFFYLVRAENAAGVGSAGRPARSCP